MRRGFLVIAAIAVACSDSPTSPGGQAESFAWTVNGQSFTATSNGMGALRSGSALSMTGANCSSGPIINVSVNTPNIAAGTFTVQSGAVNISWTPDARTGAGATEAWYAPGIPHVVNNVLVTGGSGSVTISSVTADWVSGSFTGEVMAGPANRDQTPRTVQGTFELSTRQRTIC